MQVTEKDELMETKERELAEAQRTLQSIETLLAANFKKTRQQRDSSDENMEDSSSSPHAKRPKLQVKARTCMISECLYNRASKYLLA